MRCFRSIGVNRSEPWFTDSSTGAQVPRGKSGLPRQMERNPVWEAIDVKSDAVSPLV